MKLFSFEDKNVLLTFNKTLLLNHYTHLGFKKTHLHQSYRKALIGLHSGISLINYNLTLYSLRLASNFLLRLILANKKLVFVLYETDASFAKIINFRGHYHIFGKWPAGLLTNSITTLESEILLREGNFFPFLPNASFTIAPEPEKGLIVLDESNKMFMPGFTVVDSNYDLDFFPFWIPANTKSDYSRLFFCYFINSLLTKSDLIKKIDFLYFSRRGMFKKALRIRKRQKELWLQKKRRKKKWKN